MAQLPPVVATPGVVAELLDAGIKEYGRGKVRHTFYLPDHPDLLLSVATDRISVFDFVLNPLVPNKGKVLTAMNVFWRTGPLKGFNHDLVAWGTGIDQFLPACQRGNRELQERAVIVQRLGMLPIEDVVRGHCTGSIMKEYAKFREGIVNTVWGHILPLDLFDGNKLYSPISTPTTKSMDGHDEPLNYREVREEYGRRREALALEIFRIGSAYAESRGIILADTKFEFGYGGGILTLGDEVLTPDSSRFWDAGQYAVFQFKRKSPPSHDKQIVRNELAKWPTPFTDTAGKQIVGVGNLDPKNPEHVAWVHEQTIPEELLARTSNMYENIIFPKLVERRRDEFQAVTTSLGK